MHANVMSGRNAAVHQEVDVPLPALVLEEFAEEGNRTDPVRNQDGEYVAEDAADDRERQGFSQELEPDVALSGAESLEDADFVRSFLDAEEHDVHDADPGDGQVNRPMLAAPW
jgi:hypothetical protein